MKKQIEKHDCVAIFTTFLWYKEGIPSLNCVFVLLDLVIQMCVVVLSISTTNVYLYQKI